MNASIEQIQQVLQSELAPLNAEADRLQQEQSAIDEKRKRLIAAIEALGGKPQKIRSSKRSKPCAKKAEVLQIMTELLQDNGELSIDDLAGLAKDRLSNEMGRSLSGFSLRQKEALTDPRFVLGHDGRYGLRVGFGDVS